jgi:2-polyprenyl-3-methyl-5-hydroxy-6-metoxy-1,4-benzoquinol methylase
MQDRASDRASVPVGNAYDKYGSTNPVVQRLMRAFTAQLDDLLETASPKSILDIGCGEGVLTERWAEQFDRVVGVDLEDPKLRGEWGRRRRSNLEFLAADAVSLPFSTGEFDVVCGVEVLEHLPDPSTALAEMARVAREWLLVSTPREPLWRILNLLRGGYWRSFGNTPGHINHWSKHGLVALVSPYGRVVATRSPIPWTLLLVDVS